MQIANTNPLVSDRQDLAVLQKEYAEEDTVYQLKIKVSHHLLSGYCNHISASVQSVVWFSEPFSELFLFCCRTYTKTTRTFVRHDQTETASTEHSASHILSRC